MFHLHKYDCIRTKKGYFDSPDCGLRPVDDDEDGPEGVDRVPEAAPEAARGRVEAEGERGHDHVVRVHVDDARGQAGEGREVVGLHHDVARVDKPEGWKLNLVQ